MLMVGKKEKVDIWSEEAVQGRTPKPKNEKKEKTEKAAKEKKIVEKRAEKKGVKKETLQKIIPENTLSGLELSEVIVFPLISEKAVGSIEKENKITFIVNQKASKTDVRNAVETLYAVKVVSVNTVRDAQGRKKAIVTLDKKFKAQELATKLGVI